LPGVDLNCNQDLLVLGSIPYEDEGSGLFPPGKLKFLMAEPGHSIAQPKPLSGSATPEEAARSFLSVHGNAFGLTDESKDLKVVKSKKADRGRKFVRFQQKYNDIPVIGAELIVQMDAADNILSVSGEVLDFSGEKRRALRTEPGIASENARQIAIAEIASVYGIGIDELTATEPELSLYNPILLGFSGQDTEILVWQTEVSALSLDSINEFVLVDALTGAVVLHFNQADTALNRQINNVRDNKVCRSEGQGSSGDSDCDKAYDYSGDAYTFYKNQHGRDSIDNNGMTLTSRVHHGTGICNAYWNKTYKYMIYGDGCESSIVVDDVAAHEMTHGVTVYESALIYTNQSGAINEAFSDIWGELVDQNNGKGNDTSEVKWKIGEDFVSGGIRDMKNPPALGQPDKITSNLYYCGTFDNGGVHTNSGVGNKAAYLITDGGTFNGYTVRGLGYVKAAKLFYEVQTNLLTSSAKYSDLYNALILACSNLGYSTDDCQQVKNAVNAVDMNRAPCGN